MAFLSPSRSVLILGDEGLQIYKVGRLGAKYIDSIPWETDEFEQTVSALIIKKCNRLPVVILNDMVEQHYRKELVPKVSVLDKANVIRRRLSIAFPNYRIRAALKLKDKKGAGEGSGNAYLFAAIPASDQFNKALEAVRRSMAPIVGLYLLPVESAALVREMTAKVNRGQRYRPAWTIFVGQHGNGGLRQIVIRNGELALTRMTPIVDTDVEPDLWAKEVSSELNATMSYLARFGYKESDGLQIIVIANESSQASLESHVDIECDMKVMNAREAGAVVGANVGRQEDYRYADPLHAAYLGTKNRFALPMESMAILALTKPRRVASFALLGLLLGCAYFGITSFQGWKKAVEIEDQLMVAKQQSSALRQEYDREIAKKKEMGFDFVLVNNSIQIYNELNEAKAKPLPVIKEIGRSLGTDLHLDELVLKLEQVNAEVDIDDPDYDPTDSLRIDTYLDMVMTLSFPNTINPDVGVQKVNKLSERLTNGLPNFDVDIIKQVADLSYTGNFVGEAGESSGEDGETPDDYDAEIRIRGLTSQTVLQWSD